MNRIALLSLVLISFLSNAQENYLDYHSKVIASEELIAEGKYADAIEVLDALFEQYDFVFLRDIKLATELSTYQKDHASGLKYIRLGMQAGWTLERINKNDNLRPLRAHAAWSKLASQYDSLHATYLSRLNLQARAHVHDMFKKDQKKALGALFRIGEKAQEKYAERKFAPHSEKQLQLLDRMLSQHGYPGEQLIGNRLWASVILCHHNSISRSYNAKDSLYHQMKPQLIRALERGEISPYEMAQIEDWRTAGLSSHDSTSFGFIGKIPDLTAYKAVDENRAQIGLRSIELRNKLIDIEKSTGLNMHLPKGWQKAKIKIAE